MTDVSSFRRFLSIVLAVVLLTALPEYAFAGDIQAALKSPNLPFEVKEYSFKDGQGLTHQGLIGVPQAETSPVAFLLHGRHLKDEADKTPYYQGLDYLVRALAGRGYLTLAMDLNPLYANESGDEVELAIDLVDAHLKALKAADAGEDIFGIALKDKAQINTLVFIGHSRGGGMAPLLANYYKDKGLQVPACVLLAPTSYIGVMSEDGQKVIGQDPYPLPTKGGGILAAPGVPTAVLLPQFDGDVKDQPGYSNWMNAMQVSKPNVPVLCAYTHSMNHAGINAQLDGTNDPLTFKGTALAPSEDIQEYVSRFVGETMTASQAGKPGLVSIAMGGVFTSYPLPTALTLYAPEARGLITPSGKDKPGTHVEGMALNYLQSSGIQDNAADSGAFIVPGFDGSPGSHAKLYRLSWDKPGEVVYLDILPLKEPLSASGHLLLYWAADATSPNNKAGLALELLLEDSGGKQAALPFDSGKDLSLFVEKGQVEEDPTGRAVFSHATPLLTQIIALSDVEGIDIKSLKRIGIRGKSPSGALMLYDIRYLQD